MTNITHIRGENSRLKAASLVDPYGVLDVLKPKVIS